MPSWSIHLMVAKKANKKLKLNQDLFYYGNLIPDVDYETSVSRYEAHFYDDIPYPNCPKEKMINIDKFLKTYNEKLDNHLVLGYYSHLLTDLFFNNAVYSKCWVQDKNNDIIGIKFKNGKIKYIDKEDKKRIKRKYKHKDFELYGRYLYNDNLIEIPSDKNIVLSNIIVLIPQFLNKELVDKRFNYLENGFSKFNKLSLFEKIFKHKYCLFDKNELDSLLEDCVNFIIKEISKLK